MSELEQILEESMAVEPFKMAVRGYGMASAPGRISIDGYAPAVKVRRLLTHILATEAHLPIEQITVRARSGCSDFAGTVKLETATESHVYSFIWDCRWRAEQEGWTDYFGFPDQIRAARECDWRCFERWESVGVSSLSAAF